MSIATRCPHCQTVFRLVPDQLRLHSGLVRCGHCHGVFDGAAERYELPPAPAEEVTHNYSLSPAWDPWSARSEARVEPTFPDAAAASPDPAEAAAGMRPSMAAAAAAPRTAAPASPASGPAAQADDGFPVTLEARREARGARLAWRILGSLIALALLALLLGQLAWWQRDRIMLRWPATQNLYAQACALTGCSVGPIRVIEGLQIENTQLQRIDSPGQLELKMVLHNLTANTIAYPAIELTLLDDKNAVAIRRVIWPQNYLPADIAAASGLPPQGRQLLLMRLDTGKVAAANYRIIIFYP